jgi:putative ABC transport system permease protein
MATAQGFKGAKEIGTRKVLGSPPRAIFVQFMTEKACITLFAAILAFAMVFIMAPILNNWLQTQLSFNVLTDHRILAFVVAVLIIVTLAAGSYPAIILSRFKPVNALKNQIGGQIPAGGLYKQRLNCYSKRDRAGTDYEYGIDNYADQLS